ncbi:macrolide ABC transporter ATP-binding protein [Candidatus Berkelbacteria bacterium RIFCSPLOWO2_01_FULL_50_28]|uniref:Macrolide ABC transporter ATP-binding protein n=1 Tax=Candidatus Berkelbacteria bacterium RIFCSPLOWO2_01_FULL_50_28 TaxID=1797471 RepID=A0A1F5ECG4_9BACT|nr:MAG: macrolide ABC transporter ATP-binding protein [Candidatus Berkelbacteria bacterium RIFCSPHIGHO2_01_FULL_50_36]OGD63621.1 MAG: macrolide ABC transporter ATP-binding protein [Candidatus Berkelbacteria bacterium RIFCSPHIGHO2_12_FULL_50_11]OGD65097.1 MAG: macrolide ABC transporter ATP-binding protein [Candidatus Berkelbacteria bacterium RIFCSPLOWO2_01_FULL_50_28]
MLELKNATKRFTDGEVVNALDGVSITVERGEFVGIIGPSGCGKSTLLYTLGLLDSTDEGEYRIGDQLADELTRKQRAKLRNKKFGFVFQSFNLLARTSSYDNVILPLLYGQTAGAATKTQASLERVGLWNKRKNWPNQLSGGQQQRVAIARALVNEPEIILADEPTGNLDSKTGVEIMNLFKEIHAKGTTVVMVTHNPDLLKYATRIIEMRDGRIVRDENV